MRRVVIGAAVALLAGCASIDPYASEPIAAHLQRDGDVGYVSGGGDSLLMALGVRPAGRRN